MIMPRLDVHLGSAMTFCFSTLLPSYELYDSGLARPKTTGTEYQYIYGRKRINFAPNVIPTQFFIVSNTQCRCMPIYHTGQ